MIGLLDPAFLLPRTSVEEEEVLVDELDRILRICRDFRIELPPFDEYWPELWRTLGRDLERSVDRPDARDALHQLRKLGDEHRGLLQVDTPTSAEVWRRGFSELFRWAPLDESWERRMAEAAVRAATIARERDVILLVRRVVNRNVTVHEAQNTTLDENTRWLLHIQPRVLGHRRIRCVHHPRNVSEPWTTRFDWRLPAKNDGARYPFCPPDRWWNPSTPAMRTVSSKPAWCDARGNGWSRPNIPGGAGYHWDVYIRVRSLSAAIGVDQINVVEFGAPPSEGSPGSLHHVPSEKKGRVIDCGWNCP